MTKSVDTVVGLKDDRYFIDVPEGEINTFFEWRPDFPELIAAHRGGGFLPGFPENVIASMENSLRFGPTILEIDIQRTLDGVLILMHDDTLDRTTTGSGVIAETDWSTIQTLHAVDTFGNPTPYRIPTLQETLEWGRNRALFALDLKADDFVAEVVGMVMDLDVEDDVIFFAETVEQMLKVYSLNPNIHFALLMTPDTREDLVNAVADSPIPLESLTAFTVAPTIAPAYNQALHDQGIVSIFGAFIPEYELSEENAITLYQHLIDQGVDSISTNRLPDLGAALGYEPQPAR
ncbi:MAG: glycerophosphodiester phosphodiesterase family protein [Cyanobacteria bacterium P01_F01_bin.86]